MLVESGAEVIMSDLIATVQKDVEMYGDQVTAVRAGDGEIYVTLTHMCEALGLDTQAQARRIQRHAVLSEGIGWVVIMATQGDGPDQRRRVQALRADLVPLWLTGVQASRVDEKIRPKLEQLQRNAARILWQAFQSGELTGDLDLDALLEQDSETVQAYKMLTAMLKLARQQIVLESRVTSVEARLEDVEAKLAPSDHAVTNAQASQISQAVRAVGTVYSEQSGRNEFGAVYGELYRKFKVTSYLLIPANKFEAVMKWLSDWYQSLTNEELPF
jgi:hypothetical protein